MTSSQFLRFNTPAVHQAAGATTKEENEMGLLTGGTWTGEVPANGGTMYDHPRNVPKLNWDSIARCYVEHDREAQETFGEMVEVGSNPQNEAFAALPRALNDNLPVADQPARRIQDDPAYQEFERLGNELGEHCVRPGPAFAGRKGDWLQTFSGRQFWPMDPRPEEVFIEDIAHALSMQCRYAGHCLRFYSVAEHSVLLARYFQRQGASIDVQLLALLHDASEAYLVDVPRPVKPFLAGYKDAEARVMAAVCDKFGLPHEMPAEVHAADGAIIGNERANMAPCVAEWCATGPGLEGVYLRNWTPQTAELEFTAEFRRLMDERHEAERTPMDPFELAADRAASRADFENKARREAA